MVVNSIPIMTKIALGANGPDLGRGSHLPGEVGGAQDGRGPGKIFAILLAPQGALVVVTV